MEQTNTMKGLNMKTNKSNSHMVFPSIYFRDSDADYYITSEGIIGTWRGREFVPASIETSANIGAAIRNKREQELWELDAFEKQSTKANLIVGKLCSLALLMLMALTVSASGRSLTIQSSPGITRNAGQTIPLVFNASGFAPGATAQIWLLNSKTWIGDIVEIDVPVQNGVNTHDVVIPWSFGSPGRYVVKIVSGANVATDKRIVTIRSAIIWPYFGTTYPQGGLAEVSWVVGDWYLGEFMQVSLHDEDTGQLYELDYSANPYMGSFQFFLPPDITGDHFRIYLDSFFVVTIPTSPDDPESDQSYPDYVQGTRSAVVAIH